MAPTCPCISARGMPHYVEKPAENGHTDRPKKKRWSFGGLFKRKSKKESDTSSDDEEGKGFLRRKKQTGSKDVTGSFVVQGVGRRVGGSTGSLDIQNRKMTKAKVEASREALESSSGDEGSYSSSLASGGGSLNRKSRAARTERYMRRRCEQWSPSPTRKTHGLEQRSGSEQGLAKKIRAPLYIPPPPPVRPPTVAARSISDQYLTPPPIPHRKPLTSLTNSELSITSSKSDASNYREYIHPSTPEKIEIKKPPTPPERRSSRHSMVFPECFDIKKRNSNNLEQALNELEAIYNSLRLGEDEHDKNHHPHSRASSKTGMESNFSTSQNSLSKRRPEKSDDMAFRRWNKKNPNVSDTREIMSQAGSYLLLSPSMSPPPLFPQDPNEPHVTLDDVVYRNMNHTNNTLRVLDPQPPFGIPIGPHTPAPQSDYLHVSPSQSTQNLVKTRVPDVVLDDLAFRNLRKDAADSTVNIKKKKATRSLSANLAHILIPNDKTHPVRGNYHEVNNNLDENKSPSYSDIPKDLRLAQRMLDIRLMNLRNKIKDQERNKMNSSSETLHNSNRSNSATPERRTPTREPQRARFGSDGQFKYSDLHPRTPPERRIVFREEWRRPKTPEKKTVCKEELRKKFFADAYKNIDKNNHHHVWNKPTQKLTENPHHRIHFPHSKNTDPARMKPPRAEVNRTVAYTPQQQSSLRRSPVPQRALTGEYFFPKDFEVPKPRRSPTVEEHYVGYSARNRVPSPQRRVPSPHPATPPSSPAKSLRSSQHPTPEPKEVHEVNVKSEEKSESTICNGHNEKPKVKHENEVHKRVKETSQTTDSDSGRATPSGEEVRRILCQEETAQKSEEEKEEEREREENELLKQLEEEATATGLEMDRELRSLAVSHRQDKIDERQSNEVSSRRVADLLRELTRSLDYDFGPDGLDDNAPCGSCRELGSETTDLSTKSPERDLSSGSLIIVAYCMAVAQQLTTVDALSLFALILAVISVFLFVYL